MEIRSLLDSRTFLSRSDGKVVGNRSSDRLEGWWHGEGVEGGAAGTVSVLEKRRL